MLALSKKEWSQSMNLSADANVRDQIKMPKGYIQKTGSISAPR